MQQGLGIMLAVMAGTMAAMGSVCAKLAMTEEAINRICTQTVSGLNVPMAVAENFCDSVSIKKKTAVDKLLSEVWTISLNVLMCK